MIGLTADFFLTSSGVANLKGVPYFRGDRFSLNGTRFTFWARRVGRDHARRHRFLFQTKPRSADFFLYDCVYAQRGCPGDDCRRQSDTCLHIMLRKITRQGLFPSPELQYLEFLDGESERERSCEVDHIRARLGRAHMDMRMVEQKNKCNPCSRHQYVQ